MYETPIIKVIKKIQKSTIKFFNAKERGKPNTVLLGKVNDGAVRPSTELV